MRTDNTALYEAVCNMNKSNAQVRYDTAAKLLEMAERTGDEALIAAAKRNIEIHRAALLNEVSK